MANRNPSEQSTQRDQTTGQQAGAADRSAGQQQAGAAGQQQAGAAGQQQAGATDRSAGQQQAAGGTQAAVRTDRERGVETTREVGRPRRATTTGQQRGGAMTPWMGQVSSPFTMMRRMMDDMDRMFENVGVGRGLGLSPWRAVDELDALTQLPALAQTTALWAPAIEVFERGNDLVVRADLPGLSKDDVNVEVENGVLTISGERRAEQEENREGFYRSERIYGAFSRSIALPEGVNEDQVKATFKDGVLEVTIPKPSQEQRGGRRIDVK